MRHFDTDTEPELVGTRTVDKVLHRDLIGSGHAYLNPTGPKDYDRVEELPPPVYGLLTMADLVRLKRRRPRFEQQYRRVSS